jgi:hypothetical protein
MEILLQQPDRQNLAPLTNDELRLYDLESAQSAEHTMVSKPYNSSVRSGGSSESWQYYNKYNISNINKNTDQSAVEVTNNIDNTNKVTNVFIEQELMASKTEVSQGLQVADKFDSQAFALAKEMPYPEAVKQADLALTNTEHWLVTKAAYTLQKQATITSGAAVTEPEQRLIALWDSFADHPAEAENQEFLLRKSWLVKLLNPTKTTEVVNSSPTSAKTIPLPKPPAMDLPAEKQDKARKFAYALRERGLAKGYAAEISTDALADEFIYHAASWVPERLNCKTRAEQIDAALSFAWRAAEAGRWKCPYQLLNAQIQQRELEAAKWRGW